MCASANTVDKPMRNESKGDHKKIIEAVKILFCVTNESIDRKCLDDLSLTGARNRVLRIKDTMRYLSRINITNDSSGSDVSASRMSSMSLKEFSCIGDLKILECISHLLDHIYFLFSTADDGDTVLLGLSLATYTSVLIDVIYQASKAKTTNATAKKFQKNSFNLKEKILSSGKIIEIRSVLARRATEFREIGIPLVLLNAEISELQNGVDAIIQPDKTVQLLWLTGGALCSAAKSYLTMQIDVNLFNNIMAAARIGGEKLKEVCALRLRVPINAMRSVLSQSLNDEQKFDKNIEIFNIQNMVRDLQQNLVQRDSSAQAGMAFVKFLAEMWFAAFSTPQSGQVDLVWWIVNGDSVHDSKATAEKNQSMFWGLRGLSSFGDTGEFEIHNQALDSVSHLKSLAEGTFLSFCENQLDFNQFAQALQTIISGVAETIKESANSKLNSDLNGLQSSNFVTSMREAIEILSTVSDEQIISGFFNRDYENSDNGDTIEKDLYSFLNFIKSSEKIFVLKSNVHAEVLKARILEFMQRTESILKLHKEEDKKYLDVLNLFASLVNQLLPIVETSLQFIKKLANALGLQLDDDLLLLTRIFRGCMHSQEFQKLVHNIVSESDRQAIKKKIQEINLEDAIQQHVMRAGEPFETWSGTDAAMSDILRVFRAIPDDLSDISPQLTKARLAIHHMLEILAQLEVILQNFRENLNTMAENRMKDDCISLTLDQIIKKKTEFSHLDGLDVDGLHKDEFKRFIFPALRYVLDSQREISFFKTNQSLCWGKIEQLILLLSCQPVHLSVSWSGCESLSGNYFPVSNLVNDNIDFESECGDCLIRAASDDSGMHTWVAYKNELKTTELPPRIWLVSNAESPCRITEGEQENGWITLKGKCTKLDAYIQPLLDVKLGYALKQSNVEDALNELDRDPSVDSEGRNLLVQMKDARDALAQSASMLVRSQLDKIGNDLDVPVSTQFLEEEIFSEVGQVRQALNTVFRPLLTVSELALDWYLAKKSTWRVRSVTIYFLLQMKFALKNKLLNQLSGVKDLNSHESKVKSKRTLSLIQSILMHRKALEINPMVRSSFESENFAEEALKFRFDSWQDPKLENEQASKDIVKILAQLTVENDSTSDFVDLESNLEKLLLKPSEKARGDQVLRSLSIKNLKALSLINQKIEDKKEELKTAWKQSQQTIQDKLEASFQELTRRMQNVAVEADPVSKSKLMLSCRKIQNVVKIQLNNVEGISQETGLVVSFLSDMQTKLDGLSKQLTKLAFHLHNLDENVQQLVGQPVMNVLQSKREEVLAKARCWPREVHIPLQVKTEKPDSNCSESQPRYCMDEVKQFLGYGKDNSLEVNSAHPRKSTLLIMGEAGSGKSTFGDELELFILGKFSMDKKTKNVDVVCIRAHLPTLQNPFSNLFSESLEVQYKLREAQINSLKDKARSKTENIEIIFILDGFDEMRAEARNRNIYVGNNLGKLCFEDPCRVPPKAIFLIRTGQYKDTKNIHMIFSPDSHNDLGLQIIEIMPFKIEKVEDFLRSKLKISFVGSICTDLQVTIKHENFMSIVNGIMNRPNLRRSNLNAVLKYFNEYERHESSCEESKDDEIAQGFAESYDEIARFIVLLYKQNAISSVATHFNCESMWEMNWMRKIVNREAGKHDQILATIKSVPGLLALITSPFIATIILEVLKHNNLRAASVNGIRSRLVSMFDNEAGHRAWQMLIDEKIISVDNPEWLLRHSHAVSSQGARDEPDDKLYSDLMNKLDKISEYLARSELLDNVFADSNVQGNVLHIKQRLKEVLNECPVRRFRLYKFFVAQWVDREVKAKIISCHSIYSIAQLKNEAWMFMRKFACFLKKKDISEVVYDAGSVLFSVGEHNQLDEFFGISDQFAETRAFVRSIIPLSVDGNRFKFAQTTVAEFLVSDAVRREAKELMIKAMLAPRVLRKILDRVVNYFSAQDRSNPSNFELSEKVLVESQEDADDKGVARLSARTIFDLIESMTDSTLQQINLRNERGVVEFLVDSILDDFQIWQTFLNLFLLCRISSGTHSPMLKNLEICINEVRKILAVSEGRDLFKSEGFAPESVLQGLEIHLKESQSKSTTQCRLENVERTLADLGWKLDEVSKIGSSSVDNLCSPMPNVQGGFIDEMQRSGIHPTLESDLHEKLDLLTQTLSVLKQRTEDSIGYSKESRVSDNMLDVQVLENNLKVQFMEYSEQLRFQLEKHRESIEKFITAALQANNHHCAQEDSLRTRSHMQERIISSLEGVLRVESISLRECIEAVAEANRLSTIIIEATARSCEQSHSNTSPPLGLIGDIAVISGHELEMAVDTPHELSLAVTSSPCDSNLLALVNAPIRECEEHVLMNMRELFMAASKETQSMITRGHDAAAERFERELKEQLLVLTQSLGALSAQIPQRAEVEAALLDLRESLRERREAVGRETKERLEEHFSACTGGVLAELVPDPADVKRLLESLNDIVARLDRLGVRRAAAHITGQLTNLERQNAAWLRLAETSPLHWGKQKLSLRRVLQSVGELKDNAELGALLKANIQAINTLSAGRRELGPALDVVPEESERD